MNNGLNETCKMWDRFYGEQIVYDIKINGLFNILPEQDIKYIKKQEDRRQKVITF